MRIFVNFFFQYLKMADYCFEIEKKNQNPKYKCQKV